MSPDELIAVIERGLTSDEAAARAWLPFGNPDETARNHIARHDPSRVLADVESKREILAEYKSLTEDYDETSATERAYMTSIVGFLRALARPYLDQESPPAMEADAGDESPCGYVRETWDGPYRMRDRCTAAAGHRGGHGPWEMTS